MSGSGSSKKLAKKDAALAMLQYISDGGEMLVNDDGNKESALQSSEVLITSAFFFVLSSVFASCITRVKLYVNACNWMAAVCAAAPLALANQLPLPRL